MTPIVMIAVITIVGGAISLFERTIIRQTRSVQSSLISQQKAYRALFVFSREVRGAQPSAAGAYPIAEAATSSLTFFANVDNDADIERVRYFLATTTLYRGLLEPTGTTYNSANERVSSIVVDTKNSQASPLFDFYDENYDGATTTPPLTIPVNISDIRLIRLSLPIKQNTLQGSTYKTYSAQVTLRNLKDNL